MNRPDLWCGTCGDHDCDALEKGIALERARVVAWLQTCDETLHDQANLCDSRAMADRWRDRGYELRKARLAIERGEHAADDAAHARGEGGNG
jgi:hypothetical protein